MSLEDIKSWQEKTTKAEKQFNIVGSKKDRHIKRHTFHNGACLHERNALVGGALHLHTHDALDGLVEIQPVLGVLVHNRRVADRDGLQLSLVGQQKASQGLGGHLVVVKHRVGVSGHLRGQLHLVQLVFVRNDFVVGLKGHGRRERLVLHQAGLDVRTALGVLPTVGDEQHEPVVASCVHYGLVEGHTLADAAVTWEKAEK